MTIRESFEKWYRSIRKVETDMYGNVPSGYMGNESILTRKDDGSYMYQLPHAAWSAFSFRAQLPAFRTTSERETFETWFYLFRKDREKNSDPKWFDLYWPTLISHNGYRFVSDYTQHCAIAWGECVRLHRLGEI